MMTQEAVLNSGTQDQIQCFDQIQRFDLSRSPISPVLENTGFETTGFLSKIQSLTVACNFSVFTV